MGLLDGLDSSGQPLTPPSAGGSVAVSGAEYLGKVFAGGVQMWECQMVDGHPKWVNLRPVADLEGDTGSFGRHYKEGDPTWMCDLDGSWVKAKKAGEEPNGHSIPLLKLQASDTSGSGAMHRVHWVQRLDTVGGVPNEPADHDHLGKTEDVPYTAEYHFWGELPTS
jgi:hypothetical protein